MNNADELGLSQELQIKAVHLTTVSDGTLVSLMRESDCFSAIKPTYENIREVELVWRDFVLNSLNLPNYRSWIEAWKAFLIYARDEARECFESEIEHLVKAEKLEQKYPDPDGDVYNLYCTAIGPMKVHNDGRVSRGMDTLGQAAILMYRGIENELDKAKSRIGW